MAEPSNTELPCIASVFQSGMEQMDQPVGRDPLGQGQTWVEMGL